MRRAFAALLVLVALAGCSSDDQEPPTCAGATVARADGSCVGVGVPPDECGSGFVGDGAGGCAAILPQGCGALEMAVPGDTTCRNHAVAPPPTCGEGLLAVPTETDCHPVAPCEDVAAGPGDVHVSAAAPTGGDGTAARPFTRIADALAAAGSRVVVGPGRYDEAVRVDREVELIGRCPAEVQVTSLTLSAKSAVRALAVAGATGVGVEVLAREVTLDRLWVHDVGGVGVLVGKGAAATVQGTLVERAGSSGARVVGGALTLVRSALRDIASTTPVLDGGVTAFEEATLQMSSSIVERSRGAGVWGEAADVTIVDSVVRESRPLPNDNDGWGVGLLRGKSTAPRALVVRRTIVDSTFDYGIVAEGVTTTIHASIVRRTSPQVSNGAGGLGVRVEGTAAELVKVEIERLLVEGSAQLGVGLAFADARISASEIRDGGPGLGKGLETKGGRLTLEGSAIVRTADVAVFATDATELTIARTLIADTRGWGVASQPARLKVRSTVIERSAGFGLIAIGGELDVAATTIRDTAPAPDGRFGRGLAAQSDPETRARGVGTVARSLVSSSHEAGIFVGGCVLKLERLWVRDTVPGAADGRSGDGLVVSTDTRVAPALPGEVDLSYSLFERSTRAGLASFGATLRARGTHVRCAAFDLDVEPLSVGDEVIRPELSDEGGNVCGCGAAGGCKAQTAGLSPVGAANP